MQWKTNQNNLRPAHFFSQSIAMNTRCTVPIGCAPPPAISQEEKHEKERLRNNLKMKASRDRKKTVEILEGERDLEGQVIKPSRMYYLKLQLDLIFAQMI